MDAFLAVDGLRGLFLSPLPFWIAAKSEASILLLLPLSCDYSIFLPHTRSLRKVCRGGRVEWDQNAKAMRHSTVKSVFECCAALFVPLAFSKPCQGLHFFSAFLSVSLPFSLSLSSSHTLPRLVLSSLVAILDFDSLSLSLGEFCQY